MTLSNNIKDLIIDSIGEGVFTVDKNFRINFFNKGAERLTGFKAEEVLGRFCKHIFQSDSCFDNCPISQVLRNGKNLYDFETYYSFINESKSPIRLNASVLYNEKKEPTGGIVSFRDVSELYALKRNLSDTTKYQGIIGRSKQMNEIFDLIEEISDSNAPVFIQGESGTGKELIANAIQKRSPRANKPFIKINCSVFPENLLGSELFGHAKGAFTDAINNRAGRFEIADGGTIFLDEVAEMPLQMQVQLLRVLQEGTFERIGESITRKVDVRVIAATNVNISKSLKDGNFREDLFYRLNVIPIEIPPLRDRPEDVVPLVHHILQKFAITYQKSVPDVSDAVLDLLINYNWPGNIRELENVLEYAFVKTPNGEVIVDSKLPPKIIEPIKKKSTGAEKSSFFSEERLKLIHILEETRWNQTKAAKVLGIGRTTLWRKLKKYGLID